MSFGLMTWGANGAEELDLTTRLTKYVGVFTGAFNGTHEIYIPIPGFTQDGTWAYYVREFFVSHHPENGGIRIRGTRISNTNAGQQILYSSQRVYVFRC